MVTILMLPNHIRSYLIVKPQLYDSAKQLFQDSNVQTTCHIQQYLGAAIWKQLFTEEYVSKKVKICIWSDKLLALFSIAETHPHS